MDKQRGMGGRIEETEDYFERINKGRKRPWQPRGQSMPADQMHSAKRDPYKRTKFDWRKAMEDNNEKIR